jgi:hypothetical protein
MRGLLRFAGYGHETIAPRWFTIKGYPHKGDCS